VKGAGHRAWGNKASAVNKKDFAGFGRDYAYRQSLYFRAREGFSEKPSGAYSGYYASVSEIILLHNLHMSGKDYSEAVDAVSSGEYGFSLFISHGKCVKAGKKLSVVPLVNSVKQIGAFEYFRIVHKNISISL
jgi:hypothetical protein